MKKRSYKGIIITIVVVIGAVALIGWVLTNNKKKNEAKTAIVAQADGSVGVRVAKITKQPLEEDFAVNGNFIARFSRYGKATKSIGLNLCAGGFINYKSIAYPCIACYNFTQQRLALLAKSSCTNQ